MIRRLAIACLAISLLSGCVSPRWVRPVNPLLNDDNDRARAALEAKDYVLALEFYGRALEKDPENMALRYKLALVDQEVGRLNEAYDLYRVVYVSGSDADTPTLTGPAVEKPLYLSAERQLLLLSGRLGKNDAGLRDLQAKRARAAEAAAVPAPNEKEAEKKPEAPAVDEANKCSVFTFWRC